MSLPYIREMIRGMAFVKMKKIVYNFDALYREINEYNVTYWSKFLFSFWITNGTAIVFLLHCILFKPVHPIMLIVLVYVFIIFCTVFLITFSKAASVHLEAMATYKLLNSLYTSILLNSIYRKSHLMNKFKVIIETSICSRL